MNNEKASSTLELPVAVGDRVSTPADHCLCGMPHCNCGHWSDFHHGSDRMHDTPDKRINTSDTK